MEGQSQEVEKGVIEFSEIIVDKQGKSRKVTHITMRTDEKGRITYGC